MSSKATIVITTKDRKEELRAAVASAVEQTAAPEIMVMDDGSSDGSTDMIQDAFPEVQVYRSEQPQGYIRQRNRAAGLATGEIIFSLDDDAVFSSPRVVERTLSEFKEACVGVVAIPLVNIGYEEREEAQPAPEGCFLVSGYVGTAHALRRQRFLDQGGYRESFFHQGEEDDYAIRMLNRGWVVRKGSADPVHHYGSPRRDFIRLDLYGQRNRILFGWYNVPLPDLIWHIPGVVVKAMVHGVRVRRLPRILQGIAMGFSACVGLKDGRSPVSTTAYRLWRRLRKNGLTELADIREKLPGQEKQVE